MIRLLGAITGSALALAALLVLVGVPQFKAEPNDVVHSVVTLPLRVEPVEEIIEAPAVVEKAVVAEAQPAATEIAANPVVDEVAALLPNSQQWYAFWSPFRSEIAASGFVTQLQRVTGLDYRVVKIKPGIYEVAFAYADDTDIPINLSRISAATGLDMPEG
jgi:hypothetical protein